MEAEGRCIPIPGMGSRKETRRPFTITAIQAGAISGNLEVVKSLFNCGASVNDPCYGKHGMNALWAAIAITNFGMVQWLLKHGANPNILGVISEKLPRTALLIAIETGNTDIVELLLEHGANPNANGNGDTEFPYPPLLAAVEDKNLDMVRLWLRFKADANIPAFGHYGTTILHAARTLKNGSVIVSCLKEAGALEPPRLEQAESSVMRNLLIQAIVGDDLNRVSYLLGLGAQVNLAPTPGHIWPGGTKKYLFEGIFKRFLYKEPFEACGSPSLSDWAFTRGSTSLNKLLLDHLSDFRGQPRTSNRVDYLFHKAVYASRIDLVDIFLALGADINSLLPGRHDRDYSSDDDYSSDGESSSDCDSCRNCDCKKDSGANETYNRTLLQEAVMERNVEMIQLLLKKGADVNHRHPIEPSAFQLSLSAFQNSSEIAEILLDHGAEFDLTIPTYRDGSTELFAAVRRARTGESEWLQLIQRMLTLKTWLQASTSASVEFKDSLLFAAIEGCWELVEILVDYVVDINVPAKIITYYVSTALQVAAAGGKIKMAQFLIKKGANVNARGLLRRRRSALELACERGRLDMVQVLLNEGADMHLPTHERYKSALRISRANTHLGIRTILQKYRERALEEWNESRIDFVDVAEENAEEDIYGAD